MMQYVQKVVRENLSEEEQKEFWEGHRKLYKHATSSGPGNLSKLSSFEDFLDFRVPGFVHLVEKFREEARAQST